MRGPMAGMVLFMTLMITSILSVLVLYGLQSLLLYQHAFNQFLMTQHAFYDLEAVARALPRTIKQAQPTACLASNRTASQLIERLRLKQACVHAANEQVYYYVIQDEGEYPCLQFKQNGLPHGTHHYMISVATFKPHFKWIQARWALLGGESTCYANKARIIHAALISWRSD